MKWSKIIKFVTIILCIFLVFYIIKLFNMKRNTQSINSKFVEDNSTEEYVIYDDDGNEKLRIKDETMLEILKQDPEYDLNLVTNSNIENKIGE